MLERQGDTDEAREADGRFTITTPATAGRLDLPDDDDEHSRLFRPAGWGAQRKRTLWQRLTGT